jgi:hypothetical protein
MSNSQQQDERLDLAARIATSETVRNNWKRMYQALGKGAWVLEAGSKQELFAKDVEECNYLPMDIFVQRYGYCSEQAGKDEIQSFDGERQIMVFVAYKEPFAGLSGSYMRRTYFIVCSYK